MKIYIVAFAPSKESPNGVGGYDWYVDRELACKCLTEHLQDEGYDYHFMEVPDAPTDLQNMEQWIDNNVELP